MVEQEGAAQEKRSMSVARSLQFMLFAPTSGCANIPLSDVKCDVDIAYVSEVRTQHRKTAIALEYIAFQLLY